MELFSCLVPAFLVQITESLSQKIRLCSFPNSEIKRIKWHDNDDNNNKKKKKKKKGDIAHQFVIGPLLLYYYIR